MKGSGTGKYDVCAREVKLMWYSRYATNLTVVLVRGYCEGGRMNGGGERVMG